jgi:ATP-binding cassette subfamily B protein
MVGERGVTLSGGQKQRVAIARLLTAHPGVMIFDDSLSAVDSETDAKIRRALREKTADATVILISHRIQTLMAADRILVMADGEIVEQGNHAELLSEGGIYKKIYDIQTGAEGGEA